MGLWAKKRRPSGLTRDQALACTPVRSSAATWEVLDSGLVRVEYSLALKPFLRAIFERFGGGRSAPPTRKIELDELGSQVWQLIDGQRSTADIVEEFARRHKISIPEAEQSITLFVRELGRRGLIGLG